MTRGWSWRRAFDAVRGGRDRRRHTEFLPAVLEVTETPASPLARLGLWLMIGGVFLAIAWSIVGRLDVVVSATGRMVPAGQVKQIQSAEMGVVKAIHVRDGQHVAAGQLLLELDPTAVGADDAQARTGLVAAEIDRARSAALVGYLRGSGGALSAPPGVSEEVLATQRSLVRTQIQEYEARRAILDRQRQEHRADLAAAEAERAKLRETVPLLDAQISARRVLVDAGYYPRLRLYELEEQRIERVRNMDVQAAAAAKARAGIAGIDAQLAQLRSELARSSFKDMAEARDNADLRRNEIAKTAMRRGLMRIASPVRGVVQQLGVHTLGGVVQPAAVLLVVVPDDQRLQVDAKIANEEIGFVRPGQSVRIKVNAFPFTDHGTLDGRLENVSGDVVEDEKLGPVYAARISVSADQARQRGMALSPGLSVVAEIRTARRRIIQYLLSPLTARLDEAGRER